MEVQIKHSKYRIRSSSYLATVLWCRLLFQCVFYYDGFITLTSTTGGIAIGLHINN